MQKNWPELTKSISRAGADGHETTSFTGAWSPWHQARLLCAQFYQRRPSKIPTWSPKHSAFWHSRCVHQHFLFEWSALRRNERGQSFKRLPWHNVVDPNQRSWLMCLQQLLTIVARVSVRHAPSLTGACVSAYTVITVWFQHNLLGIHHNQT